MGSPEFLLRASLLALLALLSLAQAAPGSDAELLLAFKTTLSNGFEVLANWTAETNPCSGWMGVTCNDSGRVIGLCVV
jgi:hypothetical protein